VKILQRKCGCGAAGGSSFLLHELSAGERATGQSIARNVHAALGSK
jgi:hypothetical protein